MRASVDFSRLIPSNLLWTVINGVPDKAYAFMEQELRLLLVLVDPYGWVCSDMAISRFPILGAVYETQVLI